MIKIALAGNPNSGKTTLFNYLTGKNERVGNWMGVTVDKKEAPLKKRLNPKDDTITIMDLPGVYSMDSYTLEEEKSMMNLLNNSVDGIINVIDIQQLERSLTLTLELKESSKPMIVLLNKEDMASKKNICINTKVLVDAIGAKVFFVSAHKGRGIKEALSALLLELE